MKLHKCKTCNTYTLKEICSKCNKKTSDAHYKFVKIKGISKQLPLVQPSLGGRMKK